MLGSMLGSRLGTCAEECACAEPMSPPPPTLLSEAAAEGAAVAAAAAAVAVAVGGACSFRFFPGALALPAARSWRGPETGDCAGNAGGSGERDEGGDEGVTGWFTRSARRMVPSSNPMGAPPSSVLTRHEDSPTAEPSSQVSSP